MTARRAAGIDRQAPYRESPGWCALLPGPVSPTRGQIWRHDPILGRENRSNLRLIVSSDSIDRADLPTAFAVHVVADASDSLLFVAVDPHGWAAAGTLEQVMRRRLTEQVGVVSDEEMEQVDIALRALLEL
ncbi:type II toxin-antitoxin system PemK/MazF family toxin [Pseudonocardia endophytica]|uniref:mRNA-degrading endonuclease toxin of MazEF toxin-antitoxin module n=1 Tax=Pseudonocardia endophytica TaxID=401976 RepID=A0A4R1I2P5_PSEEN|nr:type II toxin-antitoxin system PemK/MazF family toxin [Pseudonocardia endophytica]TCK26779.1 mRNA-degrading endonuclease toxin of MazEF toxin-antitoxin module [Pseudonocardia endophytica]